MVAESNNYKGIIGDITGLRDEEKLDNIERNNSNELISVDNTNNITEYEKNILNELLNMGMISSAVFAETIKARSRKE